MHPNRPGAETTSKVFLQNVKVLAVGQEVETNDKTRLHANPATVATLLVSPQDSERLALASIEGRLILTLRSWTDSRPVDTDGAISSGLVGEPVAQNQPRRRRRRRRPAGRGRRPPRQGGQAGRAADRPMPTADAPPKPDVVEILRGDRFEQRNFKRGDNR